MPTTEGLSAARAALDGYTQSRAGKPADDYDEHQSTLSDLLTDLMHLADAEPLDGNGSGFDFEGALDLARTNHSEERGLPTP